MSASLPTVDRRPIPTVVIVGNDAVLAAAPATPVQLAHACLQRGFTVAVPASWGDELVATEAVRRLAGREKGPAVMCVCPYVRSRLLAPGPDLAPFLIALVAPPVAAARYLRSVYGEDGVHITYIGGCPSADDPAIDVRLTPDAFFAEIAERGIALSEQPLVFDSVVPPDRRRWCSLPGGAPAAEMLWKETNTRTFIEIDRDDASTDLAQHIISREHVLLDLAPSLGCVCSGAVGSIPPRSARVAVTALEPPRAFGPVVDSAAVVSLDASLSAVVSTGRALALPRASDERVGPIEPFASPAPSDHGTLEPPAALLDTASQPIDSDDQLSDVGPREPVEILVDAVDAAPEPELTPEPTPAEQVSDLATVAEDLVPFEESLEGSDVAVAEPLPPSDAQVANDSAIEPVQRRTPAGMPLRHPSASIPRNAGDGGRSLPRAYVAKRRTPVAGGSRIAGTERRLAVVSVPPSDTATSVTADDTVSVEQARPASSFEAPDASVSPASRDAIGTREAIDGPDEIDVAVATGVTPAVAPATDVPQTPTVLPASRPASGHPNARGRVPSLSTSESAREPATIVGDRNGWVAARSATYGGFVLLLLAVALGVVVVLMLRS